MEQDVRGLETFTIAYALHHQRTGRWVLVLAILAGCLLGEAVALEEPAVQVLFVPVAVATVLDVVKEELPAEQQSRILPFIAGALLYSTLLLTL